MHIFLTYVLFIHNLLIIISTKEKKGNGTLYDVICWKWSNSFSG